VLIDNIVMMMMMMMMVVIIIIIIIIIIASGSCTTQNVERRGRRSVDTLWNEIVRRRDGQHTRSSVNWCIQSFRGT